MLISRASLTKFAPKASAAILAGISDRADDMLPLYGFTTPSRVQMLMAHIKVESAGLTRLEENLHYTGARLWIVFGKAHFASEADAVAVAAQGAEAIADRVYGGRLGNVGPDSGWLNRGAGLMQTTGGANMAALAKRLGVTIEAVRLMLRSEADMLECACATFVMRGAMAFADQNDVLGATRAIQGGTGGLADRRAAYALAKTLWPVVAVSATAVPMAPSIPAAVPPSIILPPPVKGSSPMSFKKQLPWYLAALAFFGITLHAWAATVDLAPTVDATITNVLEPTALGVGTIFLSVATWIATRVGGAWLGKIVTDNGDRLMRNALNYAAERVQALAAHQDFKVNVDNWMVYYAIEYMNSHNATLTKKLGDVATKLVARLSDNVNVQIARQLTPADAKAVPAVPVAATPVAVMPPAMPLAA